jgi:hypothetical protein
MERINEAAIASSFSRMQRVHEALSTTCEDSPGWVSPLEIEDAESRRAARLAPKISPMDIHVIAQSAEKLFSIVLTCAKKAIRFVICKTT